MKFLILKKANKPKLLEVLYTAPKSIAFIPTRLFAVIFGLFNERFYDKPTLGLKFGIIAMTIIGIGLIGYVLWNKKTTYNNGYN